MTTPKGTALYSAGGRLVALVYTPEPRFATPTPFTQGASKSMPIDMQQGHRSFGWWGGLASHTELGVALEGGMDLMS